MSVNGFYFFLYGILLTLAVMNAPSSTTTKSVTIRLLSDEFSEEYKFKENAIGIA